MIMLNEARKDYSKATEDKYLKWKGLLKYKNAFWSLKSQHSLDFISDQPLVGQDEILQ